jgi:hypothetical protein
VLAAKHYVDVLWGETLEPLQLFGVVAELQNCRRLHVASKLGVFGLVTVPTERARLGDFTKKVGVASPRHVLSFIDERGLENDVGTGPHRVDGVGFAPPQGREAIGVTDIRLGDFLYVQTGIGQRGEVGRFVFETATLKDLELGIVVGRPLWAAIEGRLEIQYREVPAREVPHQVGGAHDQLLADSVHGGLREFVNGETVGVDHVDGLTCHLGMMGEQQYLGVFGDLVKHSEPSGGALIVEVHEEIVEHER